MLEADDVATLLLLADVRAAQGEEQRPKLLEALQRAKAQQQQALAAALQDSSVAEEEAQRQRELMSTVFSRLAHYHSTNTEAKVTLAM